MNYENVQLKTEVEELREYKKENEEKIAQYVNDSANGISDILKVINEQ